MNDFTWEEAAKTCPQCKDSEKPHRHTVGMASLHKHDIPRPAQRGTGRKRGRPKKKR